MKSPQLFPPEVTASALRVAASAVDKVKAKERRKSSMSAAAAAEGGREGTGVPPPPPPPAPPLSSSHSDGGRNEERGRHSISKLYGRREEEAAEKEGQTFRGEIIV